MRRHLLVILFLLAPAAGFAQTKPAGPSVEGVWQVASVVTTGANAANVSRAQPSIIIFTKGGHYAWVSVNSPGPRAKFADAKDANKLTDAEKIARYEQWDAFTGQGGTYQFDGKTLTRRPTAAKKVAVITERRAQAKLEDNKLTLVEKAPAGQPASETTTTLMRVE